MKFEYFVYLIDFDKYYILLGYVFRCLLENFFVIWMFEEVGKNIMELNYEMVL